VRAHLNEVLALSKGHFPLVGQIALVRCHDQRELRVRVNGMYNTSNRRATVQHGMTLLAEREFET
jgi:hypothetical protein